MKRYNNLYEQICSFENILSGSRKARKGKRFKYATEIFEFALEKNIFNIMEVLKTKTYEPGRYKDFYIYEPKKRLISAAPYFDRVIHHALINIIEPLISRSFIYDSYSCIKGKGTYKAIERYKMFCRKNNYVLKCDIVKYFQNIDHEILFKSTMDFIKCKDTLWLIKTIIASKKFDSTEIAYFPGDDLFTPLLHTKGIPIGNLTSQFFSNLYLNDFDHYVKEILKAEYYIRYCDDFVIFHDSKVWLNEVKGKVEDYLAGLRLKLHKNKTRIYSVQDGVDFLGFRIFPGYSRVRKSIVKRYKKKLERMMLQYKNGEIDIKGVSNSIRSWIGHVKHADSFNLRSQIFSKVIFSSAE